MLVIVFNLFINTHHFVKNRLIVIDILYGNLNGADIVQWWLPVVSCSDSQVNLFLASRFIPIKGLELKLVLALLKKPSKNGLKSKSTHISGGDDTCVCIDAKFQSLVWPGHKRISNLPPIFLGILVIRFHLKSNQSTRYIIRAQD